jgi:hypothetical protein
VLLRPTKKEVSKLKKFMVLGALVAMMVTALALPALAQDRNNNFRDLEDREDVQQEAFEAFLEDFRYFYGLEDDEWGENWRDDDDWWNDWRHDDERNNDEVVPAVSQDFEQQAESGNVNQSFNVSSTGDNSNQCAGIQGVANTGNAQNQIGVIQYGSEVDDFDFEDVGSTITVSPSNTTSCDQQVNQAATASGW